MVNKGLVCGILAIFFTACVPTNTPNSMEESISHNHADILNAGPWVSKYETNGSEKKKVAEFNETLPIAVKEEVIEQITVVDETNSSKTVYTEIDMDGNETIIIK